MTDSDTPEFTDKQRDLLAMLPATTSEIAEEFDVAPTTVESHRNALKEKGVPLEYDRDSNEWFVNGSPEWSIATDQDDDQDDA